MTERTTAGALTIEEIDSLPSTEVPRLLAELAAAQARLAAVQTALAARLLLHDSHSPENLPAARAEHLDVWAAAQWLGVSPSTLRRLEQRGEIPSVRIGRRVTFKRDTLTAFAKKREHAPHGGRT